MSKSYQHNDDEIIKVGEPVVATTVSVDEYFDELINQVREDYAVVDRILPVNMNKE